MHGHVIVRELTYGSIDVHRGDTDWERHSEDPPGMTVPACHSTGRGIQVRGQGGIIIIKHADLMIHWPTLNTQHWKNILNRFMKPVKLRFFLKNLTILYVRAHKIR